jgi:hypothetical protein
MLQILRNQYFDQVITDILTIAPDPLLEVEYKTGIVFLDFPTIPGIGPKTVSRFASSHDTFVGIRGESSEFSTVPKPGMKMSQIGGFTDFDDYEAPRLIEIVYDAQGCGGRGAWVEGLASDDKIDLPSHVLLLHEMRHGFQVIEKKFTFDQPANEALAIEGENEYRRERGLPLRGGDGGGCKTTVGFWGAYQAAGGGAGKGCFVATAAYGSELDPDVEFLRRFRDDVIRATRTGERFWERYWERYQRLSPTIVDMIEQDPDLRELVRWSLVEPLVHYLELVLSFPDDSLTDVPEPWASWLEGQRAQLSRWLGGIELPTEFEGMEPDAVVSELAFLLRYVLRTSDARDRYVARLREGGVLPLRVAGRTHERLVEQLAATPATAERTEAILERDEPRTSIMHAYGGEHVFSRADLDLGEWLYSVSVLNSTPETFSAVVVLFRRTNVTELLQVSVTDVAPGDRVWFSLGTCRGLQSYVLGCYIGDQLAAHVPEVGELTPGSEPLSSNDPIRCADLWEFAPP